MTNYSIKDAQSHLPELISSALKGEIILISSEQQIVQLVPIKTESKSRKAGSARGLIKIASDFDASLEDFGEYME